MEIYSLAFPEDYSAKINVMMLPVQKLCEWRQQ